MSPVGVAPTPDELRAFRIAHQLRQEDMTELLGVNRLTIIRWENGTVRIPVHLGLALEALEQLYDIDAEREGKRRITDGRPGKPTANTGDPEPRTNPGQSF